MLAATDGLTAPSQTARPGRVDMDGTGDGVVTMMGSAWVLDGLKLQKVRPVIFGSDHNLDLKGCLR